MKKVMAVVLFTSIIAALFFLNAFSVLLYFAGTLFTWTDNTQFFLLHTMMISAIALAVFAFINIFINGALHKRNPKRHFRATMVLYMFFCVSGIFWAITSGIILTIAKGSI
ncbi:MAG: hypothetical protein Ta2F_04060 [Termitinemataceae bacterium]|nr:MAG: hypothetical protein Ta2F_04060 [Termitinemataceae bacterium]